MDPEINNGSYDDQQKETDHYDLQGMGSLDFFSPCISGCFRFFVNLEAICKCVFLLFYVHIKKLIIDEERVFLVLKDIKVDKHDF